MNNQHQLSIGALHILRYPALGRKTPEEAREEDTYYPGKEDDPDPEVHDQ